MGCTRGAPRCRLRPDPSKSRWSTRGFLCASALQCSVNFPPNRTSIRRARRTREPMHRTYGTNRSPRSKLELQQAPRSSLLAYHSVFPRRLSWPIAPPTPSRSSDQDDLVVPNSWNTLGWWTSSNWSAFGLCIWATLTSPLKNQKEFALALAAGLTLNRRQQGYTRSHHKVIQLQHHKRELKYTWLQKDLAA